jgi:hypothetical protein
MEIEKKIIRSYYKSLYPTKLENLDEMDNFLDRFWIPKLNQDQRIHVNSPITPKDNKAVIKSQDQMDFVQNFIKSSKKT